MACVLLPIPAESKLINACLYNWYPTPETPFATINSASNVPLYCYLDDSDELQVVRITYDLQNKTGTVNNNNLIRFVTPLLVNMKIVKHITAHPEPYSYL